MASTDKVTLGSLSIYYGSSRTMTAQILEGYGDFLELSDHYDVMILVGREVDTSSDEKVYEDTSTGLAIYRSNSKAYCTYYVVYPVAITDITDDFTYALSILEMTDLVDSSFSIGIDLNQFSASDKGYAAFKEIFLACAHWSNLFAQLTAIDINFSHGNAFVRAAITDYFARYESLYVDLKDLTFAKEDDNTTFATMKEQTLKKIAELKVRPDFLSSNELFAIILYSSNFYSIINDALRHPVDSKDRYDVLRGVFVNIATGLWHYQQYQGITWRGDSLDDKRAPLNEPGKYVTNMSYTSTSMDKDNEFVKKADDVFKFQLLDGSDISAISIYPEEKEVLLKAHMTYKVDDNTKTYEDTTKPLYEVTEQEDALRR